MIWSLGGNYFHALSRSDLFKGWTTITLQSLAFFFFLSFYFSHKRRTKHECNKMISVFVLSQIYQKLFVIGERFLLSTTLNFTITHTASNQTSPNLFENFRHGHQFTYIAIQGNPESTGDRYRQLYCMYNIPYRETKHHFFFLLINNNSEWFELQSMLNDSEIQDNPTLVTA